MNSILHPFFSLLLLMGISTGLFAQCADNLISNGGFEDGIGVDWWNWHDNSPDAYAFETSTDAFSGDSSAVIHVLVDTDNIPGGQGGEYNSRPQTNGVIGGQFYEISFMAKSTIDGATVPFYIKDENDSWILLHSDVGTVGTEWTQVTSIWQADTDRADVHLELKVYNGDIHEPYSVWLDDVTMCLTQVLTNTCADNIVTNPGFEDGIAVDWWTWHGGDETDYTFSDGGAGALGNGSAQISVLKASSELTGAGEYNSRPQVSPVVAGQNYRVTVIGKSTVENTTIQAWVKDEFDGWTTIGNADLVIGTDWTEASFVFANETDREDVHVELKVFNADIAEPYDVWFDEVSICETSEDPGDGPGEDSNPPVFGSTAITTSCTVNMAPEVLDTDEPNDGIGWDIWDGSDDEDLSTWMLDPVLPYSGTNSVRIDVAEAHDVAEFHHRFGDDLILDDGEEYTVSIWMRSNVPAGDTVRVLTRAVRDTDWEAQFFVDFMVTSDSWLNFTKTFTADGTWDNAFVEMKSYRHTPFTPAYSLWLDDISICNSNDAVTGVRALEDLGLTFKLAPNPVAASLPVNLNIVSENQLDNTVISVVDLMGRTLWQNQVDIFSGEQDIRIPTTDLASGIYMVQVMHDGYVETFKLQVVARP